MVAFARLMSSIVLALFTLVSAVNAHEVLPSIADMERNGEELSFDVRLNIESFISGIDQSIVEDTDGAPQAADYDALRAMSAEDITERFEQFWPTMANKIHVVIDGNEAQLELRSVEIGEQSNLELPRDSHIKFVALLAEGAENVSVGWDKEFGVLVVRQNGVDAPYDGYLEPGAATPAISLAGGDQAGGWETFVRYIPVGFDHIVPKGLDHILFVLGLFFLSTRMRPLIWQISAFTLAHTITLALAALGYVSVPGSIVEPLIALSIVYVAVENLYTDGLSPWRPFIIFGFGLLHGLGFASVLAEFGLPQGSFIPALIGFNIGVEIGQIAVVIVAYLCVMKAVAYSQSGNSSRSVSLLYLVAMLVVIAALVPASSLDAYGDLVPLFAAVAILLGFSAASVAVGRYDSYREIVAMPGSILIAVIAAYWCVERVFL